MAQENMTVAQLRAIATDKGIEIPKKATKAEIIEMLDKHNKKKEKAVVKKQTPARRGEY